MSFELDLNIKDHNEAVQNLLSKLMEGGCGDAHDREVRALEHVLEIVQEYYPGDKDKIATGHEVLATLRVLERLGKIAAEGEIYDALNLSYAFVNACKHLAQGDTSGPGFPD